MQPETRYARSGDVSTAYQVVGEGPFDLVFVPGFVSNVEYEWNDPHWAAFHRRLAEFSRLIIFDKRGTGLSDRVTDLPTLETRMDDVRAVMDAAGSERAALFGISEGGPMAVLFAATYPRRVFALVLYGTTPRPVGAPDWPHGVTQDQWRGLIDGFGQGWGTREFAAEVIRGVTPSYVGDEERLDYFASFLRMSASPGAAAALMRMNMGIDVRPVLPAIRVPTLVLHREGDRALGQLPEGSHYMAGKIPGARFALLPGVDHFPWLGESESVLQETEAFLQEAWRATAWEETEPDRVLATVLFTDIVGSSERAASLGDRAWRELLERHHELVRRQLVRFRGQEVDTAGDGFLSSFDGPARAIRCAYAISEEIRELGLEVRAGLHTGECELIDGKVAGIAVHTGARVASQAGPGEVLVSSTVKDLVAGSEIAFEDRGTHELKGVPGEWRLYAVER